MSLSTGACNNKIPEANQVIRKSLVWPIIIHKIGQLHLGSQLMIVKEKEVSGKFIWLHFCSKVSKFYPPLMI